MWGCWNLSWFHRKLVSGVSNQSQIWNLLILFLNADSHFQILATAEAHSQECFLLG